MLKDVGAAALLSEAGPGLSVLLEQALAKPPAYPRWRDRVTWCVAARWLLPPWSAHSRWSPLIKMAVKSWDIFAGVREDQCHMTSVFSNPSKDGCHICGCPKMKSHDIHLLQP